MEVPRGKTDQDREQDSSPAPEEEKSLEVEEFSSRSTDQDVRQKEEAARNVDERKTVIKRFWPWLLKTSASIPWKYASLLYDGIMKHHAGFLICLCIDSVPSRYVLNMFCFPQHLRSKVNSDMSLTHCVIMQAEGTSNEPLSSGDETCVSLSNGFEVQGARNVEDIVLKFHSEHHDHEFLRVSIKDPSDLQVDFLKLLGGEERNNFPIICRVLTIPTFPAQGHVPATFDPEEESSISAQSVKHSVVKHSNIKPSSHSLVTAPRKKICQSAAIEEDEVPYYTVRKKLADKKDSTVDYEENKKTLIKRGKLGGKEDTWHLREAGASIRLNSGTVQQPVPFTCTCLLWNPRTLSPPIASDEILVSSVIELSHDGPPDLEYRESVERLSFTVALLHSAPNLEGYEVVIKQLIDQENNEWKELKTENTWNGSETSTVPGWLFPFAQAVCSKSGVSSFAAIWRPKSFTFSRGTAVGPELTCIVPDFPDVSVQIPQSCVPVNQDFCVTIQVQEFPSSKLKGEEGLVGPVLHISGTQNVTLIAPVTIRIPLTLCKGKQELAELCPGELRILHCESLVEPHDWKDITDGLDEPPLLLDGKVQFKVKHFSRLRPVKLRTSRLKSASDYNAYGRKIRRRSRPQYAQFSTCLCRTSVPGHFGLKLFCYPPSLQYDVNRRISECVVPYKGEGSSREPVCEEEKILVSLSQAIIPRGTDEKNALQFVRFQKDKVFDTGGEVCLGSESVPGVKFFDQSREILCNVTIVLASQASHPSGVVLPLSEIQRAQEMPRSNRNIQSSVDVDSLHEHGKKLHVTLLATEWCSAKGGLSTINRVLAKQFSLNPNVKVTLFAPPFECKCKEKDKAEAFKCDINIKEADGRMSNSTDPLDWLAFPPEKLNIDVVIGHGWKLGWQAEEIRRSHSCKWVQMVHTCPEELAMHKIGDKPLSRGEEKHVSEVSLCEKADLVVTVGPKLQEAIAKSLRPCKEEKTVLSITPGVFSEFKCAKTPEADLENFYILVFGRCDPKDLSIKGYDIAAKAVAILRHRSYHLTIIGANTDNQKELVDILVSCGIPHCQLTVRKFCEDREFLIKSLPQFDLVLMPSRTEGFGLTALEALSAGIPILVSGNSGFAGALKKVEFGEFYIVEDFKDANEWAKKIESIRQKERRLRLKEIRQLRTFYEEKYSWESQCQDLVATMSNMVYAEPLRPKLVEVKTNTRWNALIVVAVVGGLLAAFISLLLQRGWIGS